MSLGSRISFALSLSKLAILFITLFDLQDKGVRVVAIGVGKYKDFQGQLKEIAGENIYNATNFNELSDLFEQILAETCSKSSL